MAMRFGSFLLGGLVGAAAVVYFNNRSKSMLLSTFAGNHQSFGNVMGKMNDKLKNKSTNEEFNKENPFEAGGMEQVKEIAQNDPDVSKTVNEILGSGHQKESHNIQ